MKKSIIALLIASIAMGQPIMAQQDKIAALAFTTSSNEAMISFTEALRSYDFGEAKQARSLFERALQQDPRFASANLFLANMAVTNQELAQYLERAKKLLDRSSDWEKLFSQYTETILTNNEPLRLETAQKMVVMYPNIARTYFLLGETYAAANDVTNARKAYQQAIEAEPGSPLGYRGLANSYLFQEPKEFKKAEQCADKIIAIKPSSSGYILLGDTYRAQNNLQKAKAAYAKAINENPLDPEPFIKQGHALTFLGDYDKARADYIQAQSLDVSAANGIIFSSLTYLYQGQPAKGLQYLLTETGKLETKDVGKAMEEQYELLDAASLIAFHMNDKNTLVQIVQLMEPLSNELQNQTTNKEQLLIQKAGMVFQHALVAVLNDDSRQANDLIENANKILEPIPNSHRLEYSEYLKGILSFRQKDFAGAVSHFKNADKNDVYTQYWLARSMEAGGDTEKAKSLYKEMARYNFNTVAYALVRNDVRSRF